MLKSARHLVLLAVVVLASLPRFLANAQPAPHWGDWPKWGDQGDGTYRNPVIPADYSDLDCIRVGADYYAIASTMQFSPGMVVLHSKDLVNWSIIGHAVSDLTQISPELNWDKMNRYGRGVWAGSIRYHDNKFWVFFGTPDEGYFVTSAANPAGPWSSLHALMKEPGWDDCSALWDDDGQAYFVGTKFSDGYKTYLFKMSPDGKSIQRDTALLVNEGSGREANKLLKINDTYYLIYSRQVGGVGRYVAAKRAQHMMGPWSEEKQLARASPEANEPNQGGLVQTENGQWYFFTHHGKGDWEGRCASLLPVTWIEGWPIIGKLGANGLGTMAWGGKIPVLGATKAPVQTSDEFEETNMPPQWEWNYQPRAGKWSLAERPGWLRLKAFRPLTPDDLLKAGNSLTQRSYRTRTNEVTVKLDLTGMVDGQKAGLCHFAKSFALLGVSQQGSVRRLEYKNNGKVMTGPEIRGTNLWLKSTWGLNGQSQFAYSTNGRSFSNFEATYQLSWGYYRGDRIGIYCYNNQADEGWVDVDFVRYDYGGNR